MQVIAVGISMPDVLQRKGCYLIAARPTDIPGWKSPEW
jgi:hypothetical protein